MTRASLGSVGVVGLKKGRRQKVLVGNVCRGRGAGVTFSALTNPPAVKPQSPHDAEKKIFFFLDRLSVRGSLVQLLPSVSGEAE